MGVNTKEAQMIANALESSMSVAGTTLLVHLHCKKKKLMVLTRYSILSIMKKLKPKIMKIKQGS